MEFCSRCGEELPETANFCLKCGARTRKGLEAGVSPPWDWEKQVEQALSTVAREMEKAFETVRNSIKKSFKRESVECPHCGEKSLGYVKFCYKCGAELD